MWSYGQATRAAAGALAVGILAIAIADGGVARAAPTAPSAHEQEKRTLELQKLRLDVSRSQRHKLQLEVAKLQQDTSTEGRLRPFVPAVSLLVAFIGGALGLWRYLGEQRRERWHRTQADIAANVGRIVEYPEPTKGFNGSAVAALRNLTHLLAESPPSKGSLLRRHRARDDQLDRDRRREELSRVLATVVINDLDFTNPNHARFPTICLSDFAGYADFVSRQRQLCLQTLHRYELALEHVSQHDASYFSRVKRIGDLYLPPPSNPRDGSFQLFIRVVHGYERYLALVDDEADRLDAIERFDEALKNPDLTHSVTVSSSAAASPMDSTVQ